MNSTRTGMARYRKSNCVSWYYVFFQKHPKKSFGLVEPKCNHCRDILPLLSKHRLASVYVWRGAHACVCNPEIGLALTTGRFGLNWARGKLHGPREEYPRVLEAGRNRQIAAGKTVGIGQGFCLFADGWRRSPTGTRAIGH
eukprot:1031808-Pyramimonas_sp.AAC.1